MKIIGLTGGIGSGKSKVLSFFQNKGVPCYQADLAGHYVLNNNPEVIKQVKAYFGADSYTEKGIDREAIGRRVFQDSEALAFLNSLVHPAVRSDFKSFAAQQKAPFIINEVAILFENEGHLRCDKTILVTAPEALRIERVMARDSCSEKEVKQRMAKQLPDAKKIPLADYVVENIHWEDTLKQLHEIYQELIDK